MKRSMNNQSQIGKWKLTQKWVCQRDGKFYQEWNERNSTRTCHVCKEKTSLTKNPSVRQWICQKCKTLHLRDENAGRNGFKKVAEGHQKEKLLPCSGHLEEVLGKSHAPEITSRWTWKVTARGVVVTPRVTQTVLRGRDSEEASSHFQEIKRASERTWTPTCTVG